MFCQICKKKSATVHYTELSDNKRLEIHVCQDCAGKQGLFFDTGGFISEIASGSAGKEAGERRCPGCGMSYPDFKSSGRLGCGRCYGVFEHNLGGLIRKIHGSARHTGKAPFLKEDVSGRQALIESHRERIKNLIIEERFEEAAKLRDTIKKMEENSRQV